MTSKQAPKAFASFTVGASEIGDELGVKVDLASPVVGESVENACCEMKSGKKVFIEFALFAIVGL